MKSLQRGKARLPDARQKRARLILGTARWSRLKPDNPTPKGGGEFDDASENEARRFFGEIPFGETEKKYDIDVVRRRPDGQMIETFV
ncbi:hypothetical protein [Streptosporangium subroseum]|uniref:hypothetical protein n=1 Tax=Streptosporangium subroseum TaxID=106412 RepID=UPI0030866EC7|nr:hypothetical protein OHB15_01885 [Streptosporangium subroseum]